MKLGNLLEFRKDLYFEGAVQADWFYYPEKAAKVAENFVFHGSEYYGVESSGLGAKARIDTISLVESILKKMSDENENALTLAIADYGTGKSHLAVTLAQILSGPDYMPKTYESVINNIAKIDKSAQASIVELSAGKNFVMVINGMRDFNLHSEILKAAQKSLKLYGLSDEKLKKLNRALETAEIFFERNKELLVSKFEAAAENKGWSEKGPLLLEKIEDNLMTDDACFEIVNAVYQQVNGQEIHWDEGISAATILDFLVTEYCGMNGAFDHIVILFDEFGRYLEYASGVNPAKSGDSALQQMFEMTQNADGALHIINFIQSDIKTYLQRVDQTTNISRYIGRYDASDKYYISSNLETVFANLIQRKDTQEFENKIVNWQTQNEEQWKQLFSNLNRWVNTKGMWKEYKLFRKVVVEGIYPMHPFSTFMLTQLSDYLQNRSSLTLISQYIERFSEVEVDGVPFIIMPEYLMTGDLYVEMLAAEQDGKQQSQQCIRYDNVLSKFSDKLSDESLKILRANLIIRILRFRTTSYDDVKLALSICSGLTLSQIEKELVWLENEYAILGFDEHANCFDFMEESNGAHDFKIYKKRLMSQKKVDSTYLNDVKIQELSGITDCISTNFATKHKISTAEWSFVQEMYPIEDLSEIRIKGYLHNWKNAKNSITPKGRLIWLYINKETNPDILSNAKDFVPELDGMPIILMLLNDSENRLLNSLLEFKVLDEMDYEVRKKYERHFNDDYLQAESNLRDEIEELKKQRCILTTQGVENINQRMPIYLTNVLEELYPKVIPFQFDGFVTKSNNLAPKASGYYCSIIKLLLSDQVNENSIHNFSIEIRNRFEAVLMTSSNTAWKCIDSNYRVVPPENSAARDVFDFIGNNVKNKKEFSCKEIFNTLEAPPYGLSEEVILLMLSVVCAYYSYCIRFRVNGGLKTINNWKSEAISDKNKIAWDIISSSSLVYVDADAVSGKFSRFFDRVAANKDIFSVIDLKHELENLEEGDEVPEALVTARDLAVKTLESGEKAYKAWQREIQTLEDKYNEGVEDFNKRGEIYKGVDALVDLNNFPITQIFDENGYVADAQVKKKLANIKKILTEFIDKAGELYVNHMACTSIEKINTFRNHNNKLVSMLKEVGYNELAKKIDEKKDKELNNTNEIKSRQELKTDIEKYLGQADISQYTTYLQIQGRIKEGLALTERFEKYGEALGLVGKQLGEDLSSKLTVLQDAETSIKNDIIQIWDDLDQIQDVTDIREVLSDIQTIKQKGLSKNDVESFDEVEEGLKGVLADISIIEESESNRDSFDTIISEILSKYEESDFDFEVLDIIKSIVDKARTDMDEKDKSWRERNLVLPDRSRNSILKWKDATQILPGYLTAETIEAYNELAAELEEIISEGKIDDVIYQFNKLSEKEKLDCIEKLKSLL